jgi:hypothetical protein
VVAQRVRKRWIVTRHLGGGWDCVTNTNKPSAGAGSLVYQCRLPLPANTVNYVADLLRAHLKAIGSRWRSRSAGQIAVLVPAVLRHDQRAADLAGGNDVSATTSLRNRCAPNHRFPRPVRGKPRAVAAR